jgi:hypothetical protein
MCSDTPITEPTSHISQLTKGAANTPVSHLLSMLNAFSHFTMPSRIFSEWAGTYRGLAITDCCGRDPSPSGMR